MLDFDCFQTDNTAPTSSDNALSARSKLSEEVRPTPVSASPSTLAFQAAEQAQKPSTLAFQAAEQAPKPSTLAFQAAEQAPKPSTLAFQAAEQGQKAQNNLSELLRNGKEIEAFPHEREFERLSREADKNLPESMVKRIEVFAQRHAEQLATGSFGGMRGLCSLEDSFDDAMRADPRFGAGFRRMFQEINKELAAKDWTGKTRLELVSQGTVGLNIRLIKDGKPTETMTYIPLAERLEKK